MSIPLVIGYSLEKAKQLIGEDIKVNVEQTLTVFDDKRSERVGNTPIVVRQVIKEDTIILTTSLFK